MDKKSFLIYLDYKEHFDLLTDEQLGQLLRAIIRYEETKEIPALEGILKMAFSFIKQQLDRDREKWQEEKNKRSSAGKKGMLARWKNKKEEKNNQDNSAIENESTNISTIINNTIDSNYNKNNNVKSIITRYNKNN